MYTNRLGKEKERAHCCTRVANGPLGGHLSEVNKDVQNFVRFVLGAVCTERTLAKTTNCGPRLNFISQKMKSLAC